MLHELMEFLRANQLAGGLLGASAIGSLTYGLRSVPGRLAPLFREWFCTTVEVYNDDDSYGWILNWFNHSGYGKRCRRLMLTTKWTEGEEDDDDFPISRSDGKQEKKANLFPARGWHFFRAAGRLFTVTLYEERSQSQRPRDAIRITTFGRDRDAALKFIEDARVLAMGDTADRINVTVSSDEYWSSPTNKLGRKLESVILKTGLREAIVADLDRFLNNEAWWLARGLPYRRGYLFDGAPGCGKSSLALALATHFKLSVSCLNLSAVKDDSTLIRLCAIAGRRSILLIEDIDAAFNENREATKDNKGITFSGLLNAIDGAAAAEGQILILTTNHPERLDPALLRPGRVDMRVTLDKPDADQVARLHELFFPDATAAERIQFVTSQEWPNVASVQAELARMSV